MKVGPRVRAPSGEIEDGLRLAIEEKSRLLAITRPADSNGHRFGAVGDARHVIDTHAVKNLALRRSRDVEGVEVPRLAVVLERDLIGWNCTVDFDDGRSTNLETAFHWSSAGRCDTLGACRRRCGSKAGSRDESCNHVASQAVLGLDRSLSSLAPNGSRLSCGRSARGRKDLEPQTKRLARKATQFFPTCERPPASSAC